MNPQQLMSLNGIWIKNVYYRFQMFSFLSHRIMRRKPTWHCAFYISLLFVSNKQVSILKAYSQSHLFLLFHSIAPLLSTMLCPTMYQIWCIINTYQASVYSSMTWMFSCYIYFVDIGGCDENLVLIKLSFVFMILKLKNKHFW